MKYTHASQIPPEVNERLEAIAKGQSAFCVPVIILESDQALPRDILCSGSMTLIQTPQRQIFVTSHHVWAKYLEVKQRCSSAVFSAYLGSVYGFVVLTALEYLDGDEKTLDMAILHTPGIGNIPLVDKGFFRIPTWPIPKACVGEAVMTVGYPSVHRGLLPNGIDLGYSHFGFSISSVSERHFVAANELNDRLFAQKDSGDPNVFSIGGMSGSPAFIYRDRITHLVGFLYEGETSHNTIFFSHAAFLKPDGTLDHLAIPH